MALSYLGVLSNILANYAFIHILDLGILGAGLASIFSQCTSLVAGIHVLIRAPGLADFRQRVTVAWADVWSQPEADIPPTITNCAFARCLFSMTGTCSKIGCASQECPRL